MFKQRLGSLTTETQLCAHGCPDIIEMESGDFAVIGADITSDASGRLPAGSGCAPSERIVRIPRQLLIRARADIPTA